MMNNKKSVSKEIILDVTLNFIDRNEGLKEVTLREIAKKIGCAHTNLYNYFGSLDEIFWEALGKVLLKFMDYSQRGLNKELDNESTLFFILSNYIDFSMDHPGWYRFIWIEHLGGHPSEEVAKILKTPGILLTKLVAQGKDNILAEKASSATNIMHSYMHGELCQWINNRSPIAEKEEMKKIIVSNLKYLYTILIKQGEIV